ncbi:MAG: ankyrin repeat domain-containing protein, partial [Tagaea sp.]
MKRFAAAVFAAWFAACPALAQPAPVEALNRALVEAARAGELDLVRRALDLGADVEAREPVQDNTALMAAAREGHAAVLDLLHARGARIDATTRDGWTALLYAAWAANHVVANILVDRGADPNATDRD